MIRLNSRFSYSVGALIVSIALFSLGTACSAVLVSAQASKTATLTIKASGARNANGKIGVALFQQATGFPEDTSKAVRAQDVDIDTNTMSAQVVFGDLPQGVYAVSVRHDENMNGKLDKNFVGIPKEGYGASNNAAKKRRAPKFDEAKFSLNAPEQTIDIKLIY
jgi:uncharacterized protein (DUF2141 family)